MPASGVTIYVTGGKYVPGGADDKDSTVGFIIRNHVRIVGGWNDTFTTTASGMTTVLSGDNGNDDDAYSITGGALIGINGTNAYHVLSIINTTSKVMLEGLTIEGGSATKSGYYRNYDLDGWYGATQHGGGIYVYADNDIYVKDSVIQYNRAIFGGGVCVLMCWVVIGILIGIKRITIMFLHFLQR